MLAWSPRFCRTSAALDQVGLNGRALTDNVMDIMLTLASNRHWADAIVPDKKRAGAQISNFGEPYTKAESRLV